MFDRSLSISRLQERLTEVPVTAILGPRQCGKTTLARQLGADHYFDLENPQDIARLEHPQTVLERLHGCICIDEIQRLPGLFPLLRFLVDTIPDQRYLILGSASPDLLRAGSESLAGRLSCYNPGPLTLAECGPELLHNHWLRGGFPRSLLAATDRSSTRWREDYMATFFEQDLPQLGIRIAPAALRRFWMLLAHCHSQLLNMSDLSNALGMTIMTVRHYVDVLEGTFMVRRLQPWHTNSAKRTVKTPKLYVRDSGLFHAISAIPSLEVLQAHPKVGASWEGYAIEEIIRVLDKKDNDVWFWATHSGAEVDLFWRDSGKNWAVELKWGDAPKLTKSMYSALEDLELEHLWIVYPGTREYALSDRVTVRPMEMVGAEWRY